MAALTRFAQFKCGATCNNILSEIDKARQEAAQSKGLRTSAVQRKHVAAKVGLHWRETKELVEHNFRRCIAF